MVCLIRVILKDLKLSRYSYTHCQQQQLVFDKKTHRHSETLTFPPHIEFFKIKTYIWWGKKIFIYFCSYAFKAKCSDKITFQFYFLLLMLFTFPLNVSFWLLSFLIFFFSSPVFLWVGAVFFFKLTESYFFCSGKRQGFIVEMMSIH